ncbi:MAG: HAMP domain-containing sensor histidine kinase [Finegoldia sp.]|nr:HAMP domain-containing sensor histidine kinase [Finegoldia sp.]
MWSFLILTVLTSVVLVVVSILVTRYYYYSTLKELLGNEISYSTNLYSSYLSDYSLEEVIGQDKNQFYRQTDCQVQILTNDGTVVFDSLASPDLGKRITSADVTKAQNGQKGTYMGDLTYSTDKVMAVSVPLNSTENQVGILRYIASMEQANLAVLRKSVFYILFGILVVLISMLIALRLTNGVLKPLEDLIAVSNKMAEGDFKIRAPENNKDEIGKLGTILNLMTDNIVKKEKLKDEFISSISHELRTPLTSIKGWAQTIKYDPSEIETVEMGIDIIDKESDRLSEMLEELLDFSRYAAGKISINKADHNIIHLVQQIADQMIPRVKSKGISFVVNYSQDELILAYDQDRIKQVLINILDNAIKFTPEDGTIILNVEKIDNYAVISVIDTGIGISTEEISLITTKFYKGSDSNSHVGLGLSISEEIVKLHGGDLKIKSKLHEGTNVSFRLPIGGNNEEIN